MLVVIFFLVIRCSPLIRAVTFVQIPHHEGFGQMSLNRSDKRSDKYQRVPAVLSS